MTAQKGDRAPTKKQAAQRFEAAIAEGISPETFILEVAQGKRSLKTKKAQQMYEAAKILLPYRLPRLNNIDAVNKNVDLSHEDFIKQLEEEGE